MKMLIVTLAMLAATPAWAADVPVTTLVVVKTPPGITRAQIEGGFKASAPTYQKVPGLLRKYYTVNDEGFGGMYLWKSRAAAEAWFSPQWAAQCKARYGSDCAVSWFESPIQIEGANP